MIAPRAAVLARLADPRRQPGAVPDLLRRAEPTDLAQLGHDDHRRVEPDAPEIEQGLDLGNSPSWDSSLAPTMVADANYLYKELIDARDNLRDCPQGG